MNLSKAKTPMIVAIAVLWLVCMFMGWRDMYVPGMCVGVVLMLLHMMLGAARNGILSKKFLLYPLGVWTVLWLASFILSKYYSDMFAGIMPTFQVLGFHPSFAFTIFFYWIGGMLTLSAGLAVYKDEWLSEKDWKDFCEKVSSQKEEK